MATDATAERYIRHQVTHHPAVFFRWYLRASHRNNIGQTVNLTAIVFIIQLLLLI